MSKKREAIVALHAEGWTTKDIEKLLKVPIRMVQNVLNRFSLWSLLEARACAKPHKSLKALRKALKKAWNEIPMEDIRAAIDAIPKRLDACIAAQGGRFEK
uniref:Homeodomain-like domain-containing protein n=1 Tax=Acrobeloides nanus TaxID=290746 RepID=A0A914DVF5_9BILA